MPPFDSAIRIADPAPAAVKPVFPNMLLNVALAFMFPALLAGGAAALRGLQSMLQGWDLDPLVLRMAARRARLLAFPPPGAPEVVSALP